jgi:hypothetical protein
MHSFTEKKNSNNINKNPSTTPIKKQKNQQSRRPCMTEVRTKVIIYMYAVPEKVRWSPGQSQKWDHPILNEYI